ncbi:MAG: DNA polymerase III subunit epsilon [Alphaproteobacteria bacterium]|nr:DNA polymerase III subunit epsilon [Alphaproteobacteria bacterium]MBR1601798.1 DNA polymerase III subunit epsilon [Alphaproteobacteria bacterium]
MHKVVFDTETTGFDPKQNKLVEIGAVELDENNQPTGQIFHVYINPKQKVSEEAVQVHGLTSDFLADKPTFAEIKDGFLKFIEGKELIAHNLPFALGFINHELGFELTNKMTDTLKLAKAAFPNMRCNLDALCERFDIDTSKRNVHGALLDAELLSQVYCKLIK